MPKLENKLPFLASWLFYSLLNTLLLGYSLTIADRLLLGFTIEDWRVTAMVAFAIGFFRDLRIFALSKPIGKLTKTLLDRSLHSPNPQVFSQYIRFFSLSMALVWNGFFVGFVLGIAGLFSSHLSFVSTFDLFATTIYILICQFVLSSIFKNSLLLLSWNYIIGQVGGVFIQQFDPILMMSFAKTLKTIGRGLLCFAIEILHWLLIPSLLVLCAYWVPGLEIESFFFATIIAVGYELLILISVNFLKPFLETAIERSKLTSGWLQMMISIFIFFFVLSYWFLFLRLLDIWLDGLSLQGIWAELACLLALSLGKYTFKDFYHWLLLRVGVPPLLLETDP